jgi:branched-chain amino acid transport system ATP-binding protein
MGTEHPVSLLRAEEVTVAYGAVVAVDTVNFILESGALHGVIGPNGAGKSTFLDALSGRRRPTRGRVFFDDEDITRRSPRWRRLRGISRSFQTASVFAAMSVRAQLEMVARKTREPDLDSVIDALSLDPHLDARCDAISYGDQRRVDIAMALIGNPRAVLLDEPGAGLGGDESARMLDHVRQLCHARDVAAVLVEHDVDSVFRVCDTVTVLAVGAVLASGEPSEVRANPDVVAAYLGSAG